MTGLLQSPGPHSVASSGTAYRPEDDTFEGRVVCTCTVAFETVEPTRQFAIDRARTMFLLHKEAPCG